jgi:hypothetical protein
VGLVTLTKRLKERLTLSSHAAADFKLGDWVGEVSDRLYAAGIIKGTWYYVDPKSGAAGNDGLSRTTALDTLRSAYDKCVDGAGDGVVLLSAGTTTAHTTSYLKYTLAWAKSGITVLGAAAPTRMYGRARVANKEVTTTSSDISQAANAINRVTGSFITDGWVVGMTGKTADSGSNNGATFTVTGVQALSLSISETFNVQAAGSVGSCVMTSYIPALLIVSGSNNAFINVHFGNFGSSALSLGAVKVTGARNYFGNCHLVGAGHATPAADAGAYDVEINAGEENTFERSVFGTDSIIRAAANGNIRFDGIAKRNFFVDCDIMAQSETSGKGAILSANATSFQGVQTFARCRFTNWNTNGIGNSASAFIGTKPNSGAILIDACSLVGWTAWDSVGGNDMVYIANSAAVATGGGGLATAP